MIGMGGKTGTPAEAGVFALLALLSDPDAAKKRLLEIRVATDATEKAQAEAQLAQEHARHLHEAATAQQKTAAEAIERAAMQLQVAQDELAKAANRERELDAREAALKQGEKDATAFATDLGQRQLAIGARENALEAAEERVAELTSEYEGKLARLRNAVGA